MKKNYLLTLILAFTVVFVSSAQVTELFISKYAEGSSNNKFLEIYNGTDATISLSDYAFPTVSNAPSTPGVYEYWNKFTEGAEIAPGDVYVIAHPSADASILAQSDQTYQYLSNGDDGLALVGGVTYDAAGEVTGYTILDWLGDWQGDPGSGWEVAGVSNATANHTLTRKSTVCGPNNDWAASAGTNATDSEWIVGESNSGWDTLELYVINDIDDLSSFGVGSANNGGGTDGQEFTFPADAVSAGTFIYVASEVDQFTAFFGFAPTYNAGSVMSINGDDAIELFENGSVSDTFGDINTNGNGEAWEYLDGWAYRNDDTGPEGATFTSTNWTYSGANALDGESDNASAATPFPIGTYSSATASASNNTIAGFNAYPNPVKGNSLTVTTSSTEAKTVNIFNVLGRKIFSQRFSSMNKTMDISEISSGVYIMKVSEGNNIATKKLIIE